MTYSDSILTENANFTLVGALTNSLHDETSTGWAAFSVTCTYASATTFTISGDYTTTFIKGLKLKCTNTTLKYFYVSSSSYSAPNTTVTINGGADYSLASAAITGVYTSTSSNPISFPSYFNYSGNATGFSVSPSGALYQFNISDGKCTVYVYMGTNGTSNATTFTISAPIVSATLVGMLWGTVIWNGHDNGSALTTPGQAYIGSASSTITLDKTIAGGAWTNANGKRASIVLTYAI